MSRVHRDNPEASPEELELLQLAELLGPPAPDAVTRACRSCGDPFTLTADAAARPPSKWTTSCPSCLTTEI